MSNRWDDPYRKASQHAGSGFDADFDAAANGNKASGETEEEKREREKKDAESAERLKKLFSLYRELVFAENFQKIFGHVDFSLDQKERKNLVNKKYRELVQICHPDKMNGFSKKTLEIASKSNVLLNAFYEEAKNFIDPNLSNDINATRNRRSAETTRRSVQEEAKKTIENDIAEAENEEGSAKKSEQKKEEEYGKEKEIGLTVERTDQREKEIIDALEDARNQFASTEYRDRSAMQRIRKALGKSLDGKHEESPNIISARQAYESALKQHMDFQVSKLQNSGFAGKELEDEVKNLYSFFNLQETTKYYDARTKAKMDQLAETENKSFGKKTWDFARLKSAQVAEWYSKKVPASVKVGLAAAAFIPGASTFVFGKRMWGAAMMAAAGGMQLDKLAQFKDVLSDKSERSKQFENVSIEGGGVDFEKLRELLDGKINNIDDKLNQRNLRSSANKFVAFAGATFLGATTFNGIADYLSTGKEASSTTVIGKAFKGIGNVLNKDSLAENHITGKSVENLTGSPKPKVEVPKTGIFSEKATSASGAPIDNAREVGKKVFDSKAAPTGVVEGRELKIEKGSSIEKALIDYFKEKHPEIKNPGGAAHRAYLDYMHDYIKDHHAELSKAGKLEEYQEMMKTGKVNIHPDAKLFIDENGNLKEIKGNIKILRNVSVHHAAVDSNPGSGAEASSDEVLKTGSDTVGVETNPDITSNQQAFEEARNNFWDAKHKLDGMENWDTSIGGTEKMPFEISRDEALRAMRISAERIQGTAEFQRTQRDLVKEALKTISGGERTNGDFLKFNGDRPVRDMFRNQEYGPKFEKIRAGFEGRAGRFSNEKISLQYRDNETVRQWMGRVVKRTVNAEYKIAELHDVKEPVVGVSHASIENVPVQDGNSGIFSSAAENGGSFNMRESLKSLREDLFDRNPREFGVFRGVKVFDAINNRNGASLNGLSEQAKNRIMEFSKVEAPGRNETFEEWTKRIVATANQIDKSGL